MMNYEPETLAPPICTITKERKSSVTFDLPTEEQEPEEVLSPCTVTSPTIDICAHVVPDNMLVALYDRSSEMKELVRHNKQFFLQLQQHLDAKWSRFENTLFCDRSKLSDTEWMNRISRALQGVPSLLEKFKELVGYLAPEDDDDTASMGESEYFSNVELYQIRYKPGRITKEAYPQFFINCETLMQEKTQEFVEALQNTDQATTSDEVWENMIYKQLKQWPTLLEQLQEIVAYEIEV